MKILFWILGTFFVLCIIYGAYIETANQMNLKEAFKRGDEKLVENICKSDWYSGGSIRNTPVICLKYYQK